MNKVVYNILIGAIILIGFLTIRYAPSQYRTIAIIALPIVVYVIHGIRRLSISLPFSMPLFNPKKRIKEIKKMHTEN